LLHQKAQQKKINAITVRIGNKKWVFGIHEFHIDEENVESVVCEDEEHLIEAFLTMWETESPDVLTGWNVEVFDVPYLVTRITLICGEKQAKRLSPWKIIKPREVIRWGKDTTIYSICGISILDYYVLYRKYTFVTQEKYTLDHIAEVELGKKKVEYKEYGSLKEFYTKNFQRFMEYNIHDVDLVKEMDEKLNLLDLHISVAYTAKINYDDAFGQVRTWESIIYNHLLHGKIVPPMRKHTSKDEKYEGAYVKDPQIGFHDWVVSFDLTSLYPMLICGYNISPDTIVDDISQVPSFTVDDVLHKKLDTSFLKRDDLSMAANGQLFKKDKQGFLPALMEKFFEGRKIAKKKAIEYKKQLETANEEDKKNIKNLIAKYNTQQMAAKIALNSAYGALGQQNFIYHDTRQAEAITLSGQLAIRWIERCMNEYMNKMLGTTNIDYVIAVDTDSTYLNMRPIVEKFFKDQSDKVKIVNFLDKFCNDVMQPFINKKYKELAEYMNAYKQKMDMKREVIADRGIWTAKKRYCLNVHDSEGVRYKSAELKIMGIEVQRSSTPKVCREKLKESIKIILTGNEESLIDYIDTFKEEFLSMSPEEISCPRSVKGMKKYADKNTVFSKGTPIAVKGALMYNTLLSDLGLHETYPTIGEGDKIKFLYLKKENPVRINVISFSSKLPPEFNLLSYIDYHLQFEKTFLDPLKHITECVGWKFERVNNLSGFFG
jgi:DNA polymerase elongation subunit (family B)